MLNQIFLRKENFIGVKLFELHSQQIDKRTFIYVFGISEHSDSTYDSGMLHDSRQSYETTNFVRV